MTDKQLLDAERAARKLAQGCPIYTGPEVYHATRSADTSARAGQRWVELFDQLNDRGLRPLS